MSAVVDVVCITKAAPQASRTFGDGNIMSGQCIFKCKRTAQRLRDTISEHMDKQMKGRHGNANEKSMIDRYKQKTSREV